MYLPFDTGCKIYACSYYSVVVKIDGRQATVKNSILMWDLQCKTSTRCRPDWLGVFWHASQLVWALVGYNIYVNISLSTIINLCPHLVNEIKERLLLIFEMAKWTISVDSFGDNLGNGWWDHYWLLLIAVINWSWSLFSHCWYS